MADYKGAWDSLWWDPEEYAALAQDLMYNLTNVAANSSGESLKIRISSKMQDLIGENFIFGKRIPIFWRYIQNV